MKTKFILLLTLAWSLSASAQFAGIYSGQVADLTFNDPNAGVFAAFVGPNGQATVVGYDLDSFQHETGQAGGVAAQFNVPFSGNWNFSSNNSIYGVSGSGSVTNGSFSGTLTFTNGDAVQLTYGYQQSPLGNFQDAAGYYSGSFSGNFGSPITGPLIAILSANGQLTFAAFVNGAPNDGGLGQFNLNNQFITTNQASGSVVAGTLTNATLTIGGTVTNSMGSATFSMSRANYLFNVATTNLPNGTTNVPYSQTLTAYGGPTNYTWGIISGGLPTGLTLATGGVISGTPMIAESTNFTVCATNALGATATQAMSLVIFAFSTNVTFTVTPGTVSNTYPGMISLLASNLASGETVVIQKYLDLNTNGIIDGNDLLVQQFNLTDGQAGLIIGGIVNSNVPGDLNPAAGNITATLNFQNGDFMQNLVGKYLYKLSSPAGHFAPITIGLTVTNFPFPQRFTGNVISNSSSTTLSNSIVLLFPPPRAGHNGLGNPLGGTVANNVGAYTLAAPAGSCVLLAVNPIYVSNTKAAPLLTLTNATTFNTNLSIASVAATNLTGRVVDAANHNLGLPGLFLPLESTNGLLAVVCTDPNGYFNAQVTANNLWKLGSNDEPLIVHGYVGWNNAIYTNSGATNVLLAYPMANALFYGSVTDNLGNPMAGIDVNDYDSVGNFYAMDGYTDANGNYCVGALGLGSSDPWQVSFSSESTPTNYIFSQTGFGLNNSTNLIPGVSVLQNFTGLLATNYITGNVKFNGANLAGVGVSVNGNGSLSNYNQYADTDANGNYSLAVANGSWQVSLNASGGNDSLDTLLGSGSYQSPANQNVTINNNNSTNNFNVQSCIGVIFLTASSLPAGEVNAFYQQSIQASDCTANYNWSWLGGALPGGLNFYGGGPTYTLSGFPTNSGTFSFNLQVNDGNGNSASRQFSVSISNALQILTSTLPTGTNGFAYSQQLQATGGQPPYHAWFLSAGSLPPNLNLTTNGLLAGIAATNGNFDFTVGLSDALGGVTYQAIFLNLFSTNAVPPPPLGVASAGQQVLVYYPSSGSNYVLQTATNLNGPWGPATNGVPAISFFFTNKNPAQFYRLH